MLTFLHEFSVIKPFDTNRYLSLTTLRVKEMVMNKIQAISFIIFLFHLFLFSFYFILTPWNRLPTLWPLGKSNHDTPLRKALWWFSIVIRNKSLPALILSQLNIRSNISMSNKKWSLIILYSWEEIWVANIFEERPQDLKETETQVM